jgi:hypothetical protein
MAWTEHPQQGEAGMAAQEILILAVTQMLGGVCIAGMSTEGDPATGLRWIRPVREFEHVLLGDVTAVDGTVIRPFDVAEFHLLRARPSPPHIEDWITDFARPRLRVVRRLEGERRAAFLRKYVDPDPASVLENQARSLCLVRPDWIRASLELDAYTGKLEARLALALGPHRYRGAREAGLSVTDLRWRALGCTRLPESGGILEVDMDALRARLGLQDLFLAIGLTRAFQGAHWPMVVGVHVVPDYDVTVDHSNP